MKSGIEQKGFGFLYLLGPHSQIISDGRSDSTCKTMLMLFSSEHGDSSWLSPVRHV